MGIVVDAMLKNVIFRDSCSCESRATRNEMTKTFFRRSKQRSYALSSIDRRWPNWCPWALIDIYLKQIQTDPRKSTRGSIMEACPKAEYLGRKMRGGSEVTEKKITQSSMSKKEWVSGVGKEFLVSDWKESDTKQTAEKGHVWVKRRNLSGSGSRNSNVPYSSQVWIIPRAAFWTFSTHSDTILSFSIISGDTFTKEHNFLALVHSVLLTTGPRANLWTPSNACKYLEVGLSRLGTGNYAAIFLWMDRLSQAVGNKTMCNITPRTPFDFNWV